VYAPFYWLMLILFPPLILHYALRQTRNRNVSVPLNSIDTIERQYRPNWFIFIVALLVGCIVASLGARGVVAAWGGGQRQNGVLVPVDTTMLTALTWWVIWAVLSPGVLILILATRTIQIKLVTRNNQFVVPSNSFLKGINEEKYDSFLRSTYAQMECAKTYGSRRG